METKLVGNENAGMILNHMKILKKRLMEMKEMNRKLS